MNKFLKKLPIALPIEYPILDILPKNSSSTIKSTAVSGSLSSITYLRASYLLAFSYNNSSGLLPVIDSSAELNFSKK